MKSLILPAAGFSTRFPNVRPKWMLTHPFGSLMLLESIKGLDLSDVDKIYVTILKQHEDQYQCTQGIEKGFQQAGLIDKLAITVLPEPTKHQPETVARTIEQNGITGSIYIKDTDNYFVSPITGTNCVSVFNLESLELVNAANKSYVQTNEGIITNIIEKRVISPMFCCGGYGFDDTATYMKHYEEVKDKNAYISHIIYKMMLEGVPFKAIEAQDYEDWGTLEDWLRFQKQFGAVFVDVDGLLVKNSGEYFPPLWGTTEAIPENVAIINRLFDSGTVKVVLTTSRRSTYRAETEEQLQRCDIRYHQLIMDIPHGRRYIINDYAPSNPYPSCEAINVRRNESIEGVLDIPVRIKVRDIGDGPWLPRKPQLRIAVCISGLTRTYEETIENFRQQVLVGPHQYDIFISTWEQADSEISTERQVRKEQVLDGLAGMDKLAAEYKPKLIEFEPDFQWDSGLLAKFKQRKRTDTYVPSTLFMFYKIWAADQLRRKYERTHGVKYDLVVRTRFDVIFDEPLTYNLHGQNLCLPEMWAEQCDQFKMPWANDTFAFGPPKDMMVYADLFNHIEQLFDDGLPFQPEILLHEWLRRHGLSVTHDSPYPRLVRVSGKVTKLESGRPRRYAVPE